MYGNGTFTTSPRLKPAIGFPVRRRVPLAEGPERILGLIGASRGENHATIVDDVGDFVTGFEMQRSPRKML